MQKVGLIGLGNIGFFYAEKLLENGYELQVLDLDKAKVAKAVSLGATAAGDIAAIAAGSEIIILSLPDSEAVEKVMDGETGLLAKVTAGQLIIDTGTTRAAVDIRYERLCAARNVGFIDSPLTRRSQGQILMVGGSAENFARARDILSCLSYKLRHVGPIGEGQKLKLLNQALLANRLAADAEVVELAKKNNIDPRLLKEHLEFDISELLLGDDFRGGSNLAIHYKDMGYLLEMAHDCQANIPVSSLVHEIFKTSLLYAEARHKEETWLQAGIATYWRRLNDPEYK